MNSTSLRAVMKTNADEPEKPVRYRMLAGLDSNRPSSCELAMTSVNAAMRSGRRSRMLAIQERHQAAERELVAVSAEATEHAARRGSQHRRAALRFPRKDVRQMDLDERHRH